MPLNWTNNNCESLNNILKLSTNWKSSKLPDLIDKLHRIVKLQYADMKRALHGQGNYQIIPVLRAFVIPHTIWSGKCEEEQAAWFKKFLSATIKRKEETLKSTDGDLEIPHTPRVARKPGQRKRTRSQKTVTINKKPRVL